MCIFVYLQQLCVESYSTTVEVDGVTVGATSGMYDRKWLLQCCWWWLFVSNDCQLVVGNNSDNAIKTMSNDPDERIVKAQE